MKSKINLVIGTAIGYGLPEVSVFVKSFRAYNSSDDMVLVVDSSLDVDTADLYFNNNIKFIVFEAYKFIPTHVQNSRYIKYLEYLLENGAAYRHVFLSDVRDTVFQGDVFDNLPEQCLFFFSEGDIDTIRNNPFNARWIERNYGLEMLEQIGDNQIYCSGTTLGDYASICQYLFYMRAQMDLGKILSLLSEPDDRGSDQGYHNYLYYCSDLHAVGKANGDIVATLGMALGQSPHSLTFDGNKYFFNSLCPKVLHQYDRTAALKKFFEDRYTC